jgi:predicted PurR-regulated permease PerM
MENSLNSPVQKPSQIHIVIQILALGILLMLCFFILQPFITLIIWGGVLAITLGPFHKFLTKKLNSRSGLAAGIIVFGLLMIIILPSVLIMLSTVDEFKALISSFQNNDLHIPPPYETISQLPIIGKSLYGIWEEASINLTETFIKHQEEIKPVLLKFISMASHTASGIFIFTLSILVSGVFMAYSVEEGQYATKFFTKLAGKSGERMADDAQTTVINVAKGILGVSVIQSLFCGLGMFIAGIPFTGIWILVCLMLSVFQIGLFPVSIGVIIYIWMNGSVGMAIFLTIWMVIAGLLDNFLKPIILGKGAPVPSMVVFMGAFGGFLYSGILGLFTGAIILTFAYTLTMSWLEEGT